eukprot:scaffold3743_cov389-Prasinococcus_capsulatus_cf.AAC.5
MCLGAATATAAGIAPARLSATTTRASVRVAGAPSGSGGCEGRAVPAASGSVWSAPHRSCTYTQRARPLRARSRRAPLEMRRALTVRAAGGCGVPGGEGAHTLSGGGEGARMDARPASWVDGATHDAIDSRGCWAGRVRRPAARRAAAAAADVAPRARRLSAPPSPRRPSGEQPGRGPRRQHFMRTSLHDDSSTSPSSWEASWPARRVRFIIMTRS